MPILVHHFFYALSMSIVSLIDTYKVYGRGARTFSRSLFFLLDWLGKSC